VREAFEELQRHLRVLYGLHQGVARN
jgi:hypothetical protein